MLGVVQGMHEAVSLTGNVDDVTHSVRAVPQCFPEGCDVRAQAAFVDDGSLPDPLHEVLLGHHLSGIADQQDEDVEGPASKRNGLAVPVEPPFGRVEPEGSETGERKICAPPGDEQAPLSIQACRHRDPRFPPCPCPARYVMFSAGPGSDVDLH